MEKQTVTIYDVAHKANVSMATVSRVVNGNSNVKPNTRNKVLDVINQLKYHPNAVARGLASKKTTTVGVIIPDVTDMYFASLARGIDDIAAMYKYNIILANSDGKEGKEIHVLNTLLAKQVDGIIFMGNNITDKLRKQFQSTSVPIVLAGSVDIKETEPSINIDYIKAVSEAVNDLVQNGNQKIAFISGPLNQDINSKYRLKGYRYALSKNHITYDQQLVYGIKHSDDLYKVGEKLAQSLIDNHITAAIISDDELAVGVLNGMKAHNVKIPQDFEIITSNDTKLTRMVRPQLSSITQPLYDIGAVAMRLLTKIMDNKKIDDKNILLHYRLVKRDSTK
ncbi:catabolite control protein A [Philodulcilactobacillus myokoensis]|uniref:Catabolite control protein A n=1 Tax=Philodulcilactobacillus myokoensis TaxID=2929573 RepID=A0A9W6B0G8_9LACO|nr:catabolite control protein A [Philodulcilactobacillus myokoensis]GLB46697.1 catabolite control protein A [Philodulcilactobacillus myokoensis]